MCVDMATPGEALFETLNYTKLQERFGKWMAFVEWHRAKLLRDPEPTMKFWVTSCSIETMYDEKESHESAITGKRDKDAKKAKVDKIRRGPNSSSACRVYPCPDDVTLVLKEASDDTDNKPSGKKKQRRSSTTVSDLTASSGSSYYLSASTTNHQSVDDIHHQRFLESSGFRRKEPP